LSRLVNAQGKSAQYEQSQSSRAVSIVPEELENRVLLSSIYVSTAGSDSNAGSLAKPFRTIQRAANVAGPGDTVVVRGGTYRETVKVARSGTSSSPIVFTTYGNETVTVSGADPVGGWSKHSGSVYKARQSWDMGWGENQVFVDGQMMNEARWPNTSLDLSHPTKASADKISAGSSSGTLYDSALTMADGTWNGATMHIVPGEGWFGQTAKVTSYSRGKLSFTYKNMSGSKETPASGDPYFLTGKFKALDAPTEWFRDPDGSLYLWTKNSDSPANHTVEAKRRDHAFDLRGRSHVVVDGFNIFASTIVTGNSTGVKLNDLDVKYVGHYVGTPGRDQPIDGGILLNGSNNSFTNSKIAWGAGNGVFVLGSNNKVENNVIHDLNYSAGSANGIRAAGTGHLLKGNTIYNTGREAIKFSSSPKTKILYNSIHDAMLQTTDGGGIYTFGTNGGGAEIAYNRIWNVKSGGFGAAGIMLDNNSTNYVVHHNVVWNTNNGIKLNYAAKNNVVVHNTFAALSMSVTTASNANFSGSVFKNNIFTKPVKSGGGTWSNNINPGTDARFVDAVRGNYQLKSTSPAVNRGTRLSVSGSYAGSAPDIGALEYGRPAFGAGANLSVSDDFDYDYDTPVAAPVQEAPVDDEGPAPAPTPAPSGGFTLQAEAYDAQNGVKRGSTNIGELNNGDWVRFDDVNFGTGKATVTAKLAVPSHQAGQLIEFRVGSATGTLLGSIRTGSTGGWSTYKTQSSSLKGATGVKDLYVVFKGSGAVANLDSISFA
jgi:hypothetical protein